MKNRFGKVLSALLALAVIASAAPAALPASAAEVSGGAVQKNFIVYYPNWGVYGANFNVGDIPWGKVTVINHAFFEVGDDYKLASTDDWADFQLARAHSTDTLKGNMGEYAYYKRQYPDVKVLISVGGWSASTNFSAMASTEENRRTFIGSVVEFLKQYPFLDGIDIDWEYPGQSRDGCPGGAADEQNYTALLKELRAAYDANGLSGKLLTVCASVNINTTKLGHPELYAPYVDAVNVMGYDIHGSWETAANLASPLYTDPADPVKDDASLNVDAAMRYLRDTCKVPASKINLGIPYYSHGWVVTDASSKTGLFAPANGAPDDGAGGELTYAQLQALESTPGYVKYRDRAAGDEPYLYNRENGIFYTYDDPESAAAKSRYVLDNGYGGVLIWDIANDSADFALTGAISDTLREPVASLKSGTYTGAQKVTLTNTLPGATVRYTTDGSDPTPASPAYSGPIALSKTTTLKAVAIKDGSFSGIASYTYTIRAASGTSSGAGSSGAAGSGGAGSVPNPNTGASDSALPALLLCAAGLGALALFRRGKTLR